MDTAITTIDDFIGQFSKDVQKKLMQLRKTIRKACPEADEKISYGIPTFTFKGNLVHFSAYEHHIGFYPGSGAITAFEKELQSYETSKGTVRFPISKPLPLDLVTHIVRFNMERNQDRKK